ncbi:MAG: hypothetical protein AAFY60_05890, partial [Myxococcota bacterium]
MPPIVRVGDDSLGPPPPLPESPVKATFSRRDIGKTSLIQGWVLGDYYRDAYTLKLDYDVLDLEQEGLTPIKIGGGSQTNSIRLEDPSGGQWALRSTTKDSSRYLPYPLNQVPVIRYFMEDGFTGIHPAAALSVPAFAEAVGLFHTRPRLMYLPDQRGLAELRGFVTDEVVLLERRPKRPRDVDLPAHLGGGTSSFAETKYKATLDVVGKVREKPWKHRIDQEEWLRARLLDIFLGDWDRHADQWRFAGIKEEDGNWLWKPIPRDRDQAMAHYDGAVMFLARMAIPSVRRLRPFDDEVGNLTWLTYNARPIDALFLSQITRERWMEIAREVHGAISDAVIADAMGRWPKDAYALHGAELETKLRGRRDELVETAARFFEQVNQNIDVLGSEKRDRVVVDYPDDGRVRVALWRKEKRFFEREFIVGETEEVRVYALDGDDSLEVRGTPHRGIKLRFLGGRGDDRVAAAAKGETGDKAESLDAPGLSVYDRTDGLEIADSIEVDDERSGIPYRNQYDIHDTHNEPLKFGGVPSGAINPDDGLYLSVNTTLTLPGFKAAPYASNHQLAASAATTTLGATVAYAGHFPGFWIDQDLTLSGTTPQFARNFFGFTSEFIDPNSVDRDFFRVRQTEVSARYGVSRTALNEVARLGLRGLGSYVDVEATDGRFVTQSADISSLELQSRFFAGGEAFAEFNSIDDSVYPKRGIAGQLVATVRTDVTSGTEERIGTSGLLSAALATHIPLDRRQRFVFSTRARFAGIVGDFPFFHAPTLGDRDLRAYNDEQLAGNGAFAQSS